MSMLADICGHVTTTTGTGTITLGAAIDSAARGKFRSFADAGISDGDVVSYAIFDLGNGHRETGAGTYTASGTTLSRTVLSSTNSDAAISLSGNAEIYVTALARDIGSVRNERSISASATLILDDHNGVIISTGASDIDLTIPPNSSVALPGKTAITVKQAGAGVVSIVDGAGVTLSGDPKTGGQNKALTVYQREALDTWDIFGGVA